MPDITAATVSSAGGTPPMARCTLSVTGLAMWSVSPSLSNGTGDRYSQDVPPTCTELGPAGFDGTSLSRADAVLGGATGEEWVVEVEVADDQRATANELINACAAAAATCPTGQMAIVVAGRVVSAPRVNGPNLADAPFVITGGGTGGFTEAEASDLVRQMSG